MIYHNNPPLETHILRATKADIIFNSQTRKIERLLMAIILKPLSILSEKYSGILFSLSFFNLFIMPDTPTTVSLRRSYCSLPIA